MASNDAGKATNGQQHQQDQQNGQPQTRQATDAPPSTTSSSSLPPADQPPTSVAAQRAGMAQALEELARGERAADKLERELRVFEAKLEELLTSMGMTEDDLEEPHSAADEAGPASEESKK